MLQKKETPGTYFTTPVRSQNSSANPELQVSMANVQKLAEYRPILPVGTVQQARQCFLKHIEIRSRLSTPITNQRHTSWHRLAHWLFTTAATLRDFAWSVSYHRHSRQNANSI